MTLCDIGNSFFHFWIDGEVSHLPVEEDLTPFEGEIYYITVNSKGQQKLCESFQAIDISPWIFLEGSYAGMGVDRMVACLGAVDGVVVDAGSAITIDVMEHGVFQGGYILPGFSSLGLTMRSISPALAIEPSCQTFSYPKNTSEAMGCGYQEAIVALIEKIARDKKLFITGGDASRLSPFFPFAIDQEGLVFEGMKKILATKGIIC